MKSQTLALHAVLLGLMATMGVACGSSGSGFSINNSAASANSSYSGIAGSLSGSSTTTGSSNAGVIMLSQYGGAVTQFTPNSLQVLANYEETHALVSPTDFAISVNLTDQGGGGYGGQVMFTYTDQGNWYTGQFVTGNGTVQVSSNGWYNGMNNAAFNQWFTYGGQTVFHGFFQDGLGGVILVLDSTGSGGLGDGLAATSYSGSLYFDNFVNPAGALQSADMCWFITLGPFDCQTFLVNGQVNTTSALYPGNGYQQLGTFTGLNIQQAFNQ